MGRTYTDRNAKLCSIISEIARGMALFSTDVDTLGDAYGYLIGQFAAGSGKKAGELDPAAASAPLVTSIADATGVVIYFAIATFVLRASARSANSGPG